MHLNSTAGDPLLTLQSCLSKPRWHNLILLVMALSLTRTFTLWQMAVAVVLSIRVESAYQRLKRLLTWLKNDSSRLKPIWIEWVLLQFASPGEPLYLLIDWTYHTDHCRSLWVQLASQGGRSIPLCYWLAANEFGGAGQQRAFEDAALRQLHDWLPPGWPVILIGDRGFGGRGRMRFLEEELGWSFVLRITGDACLGRRVRRRTRRGLRWGWDYERVDAHPPAPGQRWRRENVRYGRHGPIQVHLVATCLPAGGSGRSAVWYLATNLPESVDVIALYALRMQIEESFRDYKSGLGMEQEYIRDLPRLEGLLFALMIVAGREIWQGRVELCRTAAAPLPPAAPAAAAAHSERRYRVMSDGRRGWHETLTALILGDDEIRAAVLEAAAKSERMKQRPQVVTRRQALPTKNRGKKQPAL